MISMIANDVAQLDSHRMAIEASLQEFLNRGGVINEMPIVNRTQTVGAQPSYNGHNEAAREKTELNIKKIRELLAKGARLPAIAMELGVSRKRVQAICRGASIELPSEDRLESRRQLTEKQRELKLRTIPLVIQMLDQGMMQKDIAVKLGVARQTISRWMAEVKK